MSQADMHRQPYRGRVLAVGVVLVCLAFGCKRKEGSPSTAAAAKGPTPPPFAQRAQGMMEEFHIRVTPAIPVAASEEPTPPPISVTANADPDSGGAPLTVNFQGDVTDGFPGLRYRWDFGDNSPPAQQRNVKHTYRTPGEYTATFTATGAGAEDSDDVSIEVTEEAFDVDIEDDPDIGTAPLTVHFSADLDDDLVGPFYYEWDFGDGARDVNNPTSHTYREPGQYTAAVTVTNSQGQFGRTDVEIQVDARDEDVDTH